MTSILPRTRADDRPVSGRRISIRSIAIGLLPHVVLVLSAVIATTGPGFRAVIAVGLAAGAVAMSAFAPRQLLVAVMIWLPFLGLLRRVLSWSTGDVGADPLLLVAPAALGALTIVAIEHGALRDRSTLAKGVFALCVLSVLSVVNPAQGGLLAGVGGLLFFLVPMFGFWIGRTLLDDELFGILIRIVAVLALAAAGYGLWQVYVEFLPWDQKWIDNDGYTALYVGDRIRPFSTFASSSEYAGYCALGALVWFTRGLEGRRALAASSGAMVLVTAVFLQGTRGTVVVLVGAIGLVFAARSRVPALPALLCGAVMIMGLQALVGSVGDRAVESSGTQTQSLVNHQVTGLSNPFDPRSSTLLIHVAMVGNGVEEGFRNPVGSGVGAVTLAGQEYGTARGSTEADPSNAAVALGLPGLIAYATVAIAGLRTVYAVARERADLLGLVALAFTVMIILNWLNGGMYALAPIPWLMMGWADRQLHGPAGQHHLADQVAVVIR